MSRRLTADDKAQLREFTDVGLVKFTDKIIDPNDGKEFHEGMAAGLLLAVEIISNTGWLSPAGAHAINACVQRCITIADYSA
jgi:hypothetical protein